MKVLEKMTKNQLISIIADIKKELDVCPDSDLWSTIQKIKDILNQFNESTIIVSADGFSEFWKLYPTKKGKKEAQSAYNMAILRGYSHDTICNGAALYARSCRERIKSGKMSISHIKFAQGWLNDDRFLLTDEYKRLIIECLGQSAINMFNIYGIEEL